MSSFGNPYYPGHTHLNSSSSSNTWSINRSGNSTHEFYGDQIGPSQWVYSSQPAIYTSISTGTKYPAETVYRNPELLEDDRSAIQKLKDSVEEICQLGRMPELAGI